MADAMVLNDPDVRKVIVPQRIADVPQSPELT